MIIILRNVNCTMKRVACNKLALAFRFNLLNMTGISDKHELTDFLLISLHTPAKNYDFNSHSENIQINFRL